MNVFINYSTLTAFCATLNGGQKPTGQLLAAMQVNFYELYTISILYTVYTIYSVQCSYSIYSVQCIYYIYTVHCITLYILYLY